MKKNKSTSKMKAPKKKTFNAKRYEKARSKTFKLAMKEDEGKM